MVNGSDKILVSAEHSEQVYFLVIRNYRYTGAGKMQKKKTTSGTHWHELSPHLEQRNFVIKETSNSWLMFLFLLIWTTRLIWTKYEEMSHLYHGVLTKLQFRFAAVQSSSMCVVLFPLLFFPFLSFFFFLAYKVWFACKIVFLSFNESGAICPSVLILQRSTWISIHFTSIILCRTFFMLAACACHQLSYTGMRDSPWKKCSGFPGPLRLIVCIRNSWFVI